MYGMLPGIFTPLLVLTIYYVLAFIFIKDLECAFIAQVCITRNLLFWPLPYHARLKTFLTSSCHSHEKRYQALSQFSILHVSWAKYWRENPSLSDPSYFNYAPINCADQGIRHNELVNLYYLLWVNTPWVSYTSSSCYDITCNPTEVKIALSHCAVLWLLTVKHQLVVC